MKFEYKQMKPDMGIFIIRSKGNNKCYIEASKNIKASINASEFKLESNNHPNRELQKNWKELGKDKFTIEILEQLEYNKDESKTDYSEDLTLLQMIWEEKLIKENMELYKN